MGIFGALTTAVTGMRAQSYALENISGNIANSQTTAFKRIDSTFVDLIPDNDPTKQFAGNVVANSRSTNAVQGDIQNASVGTFMAINGDGFFVVQKPSNFADNRPVFDGIDRYTRRGDFQTDKNGYLVNGAGYYLMGIPVDATTGNLTGSVPQLLQFANDFLPAQATTQVTYRANLASYPLTAGHDDDIPGSELLNPANFSANPIAGPPTNATILGSGAALDADAAALLTGSTNIAAYTSVAGGTLEINGTSITVNPGDNTAAILAAINLQTGVTGVTAALSTGNRLECKAPMPTPTSSWAMPARCSFSPTSALRLVRRSPQTWSLREPLRIRRPLSSKSTALHSTSSPSGSVPVRARRDHAGDLQRHQRLEAHRRRRLRGDGCFGPRDLQRLRQNSSARRWKAPTPTSPTNSPS